MNINKYNIKSSVVIAIMVTLVLSATYAFVNLNANKTTDNTVAGCFEVQYTGTPISNALVSTTNYLEGSHSQVTLSKGENCEIYTTATIYLHTNTDTTAPIAETQALKYKVMSGANEVSTGIITSTGDTPLATVDLTETDITYNVYIWVDSEISQGAYNEKTFSGYIYASSNQTSTIRPLLSEGEVGKYVSLTSTDNAYSGDYRIAYIEDGYAHLISTGNVTTMCTNSDGSYLINGSCDNNQSGDGDVHSANLNTVVDIVANTYSANLVADYWAISFDDFYKITGLTGESCVNNISENTCGRGNELIDTNEDYWFSDYSEDESYGGYNSYFWFGSWTDVLQYYHPVEQVLYYSYGVRPILKISSDVYITGGEGTSNSPYTIGRDLINLNEVEIGSYISMDLGTTTGADIFNIAYRDNGYTYLINHNITNTICTNSDGSYTLNGTCDQSYDTDAHINNLNSAVQEIMEPSVNHVGSWPMRGDDFYKITSSELEICDGNSSGTCGLNNELINIGQNYWIDEYKDGNIYYWDHTNKNISLYDITGMLEFEPYGLRYIVKLSNDMYITNGNGTEESPYTIGE